MVVEWVACLKSDVSSRVFGDEDKRRLCGRTGWVKRKKRSGSVKRRGDDIYEGEGATAYLILNWEKWKWIGM
ncbi:hypothetical protein Tco_1523707 [Tanacetum coccineum]